MKPHLYPCLLVLPLSLWAQGTPEAPVILEAGPHHRILSWSTTEQDEAGNAGIVSHQVTELATGLNWFNARTDQWEESVEAFEITPEGHAVAQRGQQLILAPKINPGAAVDVEMPGGQRLRSNPMGSVLMNVKCPLLPQRSVCGQRWVLCVHKNRPLSGSSGRTGRPWTASSSTTSSTTSATGT